MSTTSEEALEAIVAHHRRLESELDARTAAVTGAVKDGRASAGAVAALLGYLAGEVLPHASAEEQTIYEAARAEADLVDLIAEMTDEHRGLERAIEGLAVAQADGEVGRVAEEIVATFRTHVAKENDVLLPRLVADERVDLGALLDVMGRAFTAAKEAAATARGRLATEAPSPEDLPEIDVREIPHGRRHDVIFSTFAHMAPGRAFVLVNDHDPRPLRLQFDASYHDVYAWSYLEAGPDIWRVRIDKKP